MMSESPKLRSSPCSDTLVLDDLLLPASPSESPTVDVAHVLFGTGIIFGCYTTSCAWMSEISRVGWFIAEGPSFTGFMCRGYGLELGPKKLKI